MLKKETLWILIVGTIILGCCNQLSESLRILSIFPLNSKSHFVMFERLAKGLAEKGHQIDVYSHFPLKKPIPNYKDYSLAGSMHFSQNNLTYNELLEFQNLNVGVLMNTIGTKPCELLSLPIFQDLIKNPRRNPPYDVIIVEVNTTLHILRKISILITYIQLYIHIFMSIL
jgi:hypothetical protein